MGLKAEGAAQGYTVLGGLVLLIYSIFRIYNAAMGPGPGTLEGLMEILLSIVMIIVVVLAFDACGFIYWKIKRSGVLLALFGLIAIVIVSYPGFSFDIIAWMMRLETLVGFMILLGGLLLAIRK